MQPVHLSMRELSELVLRQTQSGRSRSEIVKVLVERGWPEVSAVQFVNMTLSEHQEITARDEESEDKSESTHQAFPNSQVLWRVLIVVVLVMTIAVFCGFCARTP